MKTFENIFLICDYQRVYCVYEQMLKVWVIPFPTLEFFFEKKTLDIRWLYLRDYWELEGKVDI